MLRSTLAALAQGALILWLLWLRGSDRALPPALAWRQYGVAAPRASDLPHALGLFAAVTGSLALLATALSLVPGLPRSLLEEGYRYRLSGPQLLPLAAVFALVTAYKEELFFRCYLINRLRQLALPPWAAAALSTALFAAGHLYQGPAGFVVAAVLGSFFAWRFLRRGNLHRVAIAHALYNLAVLAASLLVGGGGRAATPPAFTAGDLLGILRP